MTRMKTVSFVLLAAESHILTHSLIRRFEVKVTRQRHTVSRVKLVLKRC